MPSWNEIGKEIEEGRRDVRQIYDSVRRKYLQNLHSYTRRNVIIYYSGWLQSVGYLPPLASSLTDHDLIGFMSGCHGLDRTRGLDLLLHTPGGEIGATQVIVSYLHKMFEDVRVVVPQLAMSAGTMIACSAKSIVMGKQSSLGPIDPQIGGMPAHGILEEFNKAHEDIRQDPTRAAVWQPIIHKYQPTLIGECQKAIELSGLLVRQWLEEGMLRNDPGKKEKASQIARELGDHSRTLLHVRHLSAEDCERFGLVIEHLESDDGLQDAVLSVHHACMHTLSSTGTVKIIENHEGQSFNVSAATPPSSH